ncbi:uncharacterized protein Bfra_004917 [Botrytis fragariae]|uniref:Myb-like domain-containing protein n=1 Tax=Botrytis fragariae TaxID=1964551 RepID=A0A8H6ATQ7_9HELO|nr:uncharacterized protein Bfra_004917 [Botrytis fragariae]KAF5873457.1 hypothetical protein Bfra_004917 [Botrytis fragariae]
MSNSIEFYFTNHCVVPLTPEPLFEMDSNAFSVVNPLAAKGWEQKFESFRDHRNFPLFQNESGELCQDTTPISENREGNNSSPKTPTCAVLHPQRHPSKAHSYSIPLHPAPNMTQGYGPDSTLGVDYTQMGIDQGRGSFTAFQNCRTSTPLSMGHGSFSGNISTTDRFSNDNTTPSIDYDDVHKSNTDRLDTYESLASGSVTHDGILGDWWSIENGNVMNKINDHLNGMVASYIPIFPHGLPRPQDDELENFEETWNDGWVKESEWPPAPFIPSTIKPRALNLSASFTSTASTTTRASSQASAFSPESTVVTSTSDYTASPSAEGLTEDHIPQSRSRHMLPSSRPARNDDIISKRFDEDETATDRPVENRHPSASTPISAIRNTRSHRIIKNDFEIKHSNVPLTPKNDLLDGKPSSTIGNTPLLTRFEQNDFLIRSRQAGMSYKAIRSNGNFAAAESTLRGRFRTLTKDKKDRVRQPKWTDNDIQLLSKAVKKLGRSTSKGSEPQWKKVAQYIYDNGGSYHFGYATCRKRWIALKNDDKKV